MTVVKLDGSIESVDSSGETIMVPFIKLDDITDVLGTESKEGVETNVVESSEPVVEFNNIVEDAVGITEDKTGMPDIESEDT